MVRSIPPRTSTGGPRPRSTDPVRCRTGVRRLAGVGAPDYGEAVNYPIRRFAPSQYVTISGRDPLVCGACSGCRFIDLRDTGEQIECYCLDCDKWQATKETT